MSTEIIKDINVQNGTVHKFEDVDVIFAVDDAGVTRVTVNSIRTALPGCERESAWIRLMSDAVMVGFNFQGQLCHDKAITKECFYGFALSHPRFERFKKWVCEILDQLDRIGIVLAPDVAEHPQMKFLQALAEATATAIRAEARTKELERIARSHETRLVQTEERVSTVELQVGNVDDKAQLAWDAGIAATSYRGRLFAIPELRRRGWKFPDNLHGTVGQQMSAVSRKHGDKPEEHRKIFEGFRTSMYLPEMFPIWEREIGIPRYSQYRVIKP